MLLSLSLCAEADSCKKKSVTLEVAVLRVLFYYGTHTLFLVSTNKTGIGFFNKKECFMKQLMSPLQMHQPSQITLPPIAAMPDQPTPVTRATPPPPPLVQKTAQQEKHELQMMNDLFNGELSLSVPLPFTTALTNGTDLDPITLEIEKERIEYLEKSKNLQHQLKDLKSEIEKLKLEEKQTQYDIIHQEQVLSGENKYSTLRKVSSMTWHELLQCVIKLLQFLFVK